MPDCQGSHWNSGLACAMEPAVGFEPTTDGLQNRCSTTELSWPEEASQFIPNSNFGASPSARRSIKSARSETRIADWHRSAGFIRNLQKLQLSDRAYGFNT